MAHLRNGCRLHIDRKPGRKTVLDGTQLGAVGDEAVTGTNQPFANAAFRPGIIQGQSVFQQGSAPFVRGRKPLHLSIFIPLATPHIMVDQTFAHHHIHHLETSIDTARHTSADDTIRSETAYQFRCAHRCIHLSDTALRKYHMITAKQTFNIVQMTVIRHFLLLQTLHQLAMFAIHCADNTYRHILFNSCINFRAKVQYFCKITHASASKRGELILYCLRITLSLPPL